MILAIVKKIDLLLIAILGMSLAEVLKNVNVVLQTGILSLTLVGLLIKILRDNTPKPPDGENAADLI
jgi:hypothetical protein